MRETAGARLPTSWVSATFEESVEVISDRGKRVDQSEYLPKGAVPVVDQGQTLVGGFTNDSTKRYDGPLPVIVFGDHTRRVKYIDFRFAVGAQGVKLLKPRSCWAPKFFAYLLPVLDLPDRGYSRHFQFVRKLHFPLAPLPEQHRIVAEIEKHFTRLDAAVAALERVRANLKCYRAAVLKAACEGRLVPTEAELARREGHDYEPAEQLLARILKKRRARWEADQLAKMQAKGKVAKDEKWKAKYEEPEGPDTVGLPDLPQSWTWATLGQLVWSVKDGPHYSPKYVEQGVPFVTGGNVRPSGVDFESAKRITPELHAELSVRCKPEKGDILYTKGGTTGIARVNTYDREFGVWVHVAVLKLVGSTEAFYLQHALNSPFCYAQAQRFTHGVGNQDLGLTRMVRIALAVPPLPEQHRIVAEVERRLSVIDELDAVVDANLRRAERLRQAILKRAFEGKLVPQDPADEPASVLLERIRAERAAKPTTSRPSGKRAARGRRTRRTSQPVSSVS
jgi:type I restriction enzyme S subunit